MTRAVSRREWLLVALATLMLGGALTWLDVSPLRGDQHAYNLLVVRTLDPEILARDALYRHEPARLHVPWFLEVHAALSRGLGGDVEAALRWLAWPIGALYLCGHYALFRVASGSPLAAGLAALGALTVRNSLGGEFWGFDGVRAAATRTIMAGLIPLLLLAFVVWRRHRSFPLYYLLLGIAFNVHPVSAYHLAQATALAHIALARLRPRALAEVAAGMALFGLGALPYLLTFFPGRDNLSDPAGLALAREAVYYRFPYLFYPIAPGALLSVAFHLVLPFAAWLWWRARGQAEARLPMAPLHLVMAAAVVLGFAGTAAFQLVSVWLDRPHLDVQQLRSIRLVYPVLLTGLALAYATLLTRRTWRARAAIAVLVALSLVPPAGVIHAFSEEARADVKRALGIRVEPPAVAASGADARPALYDWIRRATPQDALLLSDDFELRIRTGRSITGSFKDGAFFFLAGSRPFTVWYRLDREVGACRASRGRDCWFSLGRRLSVDYAVVDPGLADAGTPPDFERVWERDGWSVWRRVQPRA